MPKGRPRRPGARYPSGDLKHQDDGGTTELRAHRARLAGDADDKRAGYPLGILFARRLILSGDHWAGRRYAGLFAAAVRPVAIASLLGSVVAGAGMTPAAAALLAEGADSKRAIEARADYLAARAILSPLEASAVDAVCVYEEERLLLALLAGRAARTREHLAAGLDKLHRHFEAADAKKRAA